MADPLPYAKLGIECFMTLPVKPIDVGVIVDGKVVALLELDELKRAYAQLRKLEAEWRRAHPDAIKNQTAATGSGENLANAAKFGNENDDDRADS